MGELERFLGNLQRLLEQNRAGEGSEVKAAVGTAGQSEGAAVKGAATGTTARRDAIDAELARPARATGVVSLREAPEVEAFREELVNGLIRVDTVNRLLRLVNELVARAMVSG